MESVIEGTIKHEGDAAADVLPQLPQDMITGKGIFFLLMYIRLCEEPRDELARMLDGRAATHEERLVANISWSQFFE